MSLQLASVQKQHVERGHMREPKFSITFSRQQSILSKIHSYWHQSRAIQSLLYLSKTLSDITADWAEV